MTTVLEKRAKQRKYLFILMILALILVFVMNISLGSVHVKFMDVIRIIVGKTDGIAKTHQNIVRTIRLPRTLATVAGGVCLAVAGLLLQIFFSNPIVEPYVLGISSGSMLFVAIVMLGGYTFGIVGGVPPMTMFWGALAGAMLVMMVVIFASRKVKSIVTLLIIGIMAGYVCSAVTSFLITFAEKEKIAGYTLWTMGSFSGFTWEKDRILLPVTAFFGVAAYLMSKPLNAMLLGEKYAQSMGVGIKLFRMLIVIISSILTAVLTAFTGPISFVGLAVPHIARVVFKSSDNRVLLPASMLLGAILTGICDLITRTIFAPVELPLGAITSVLGAPLVVFLLLRRNNGL